MGKLFGTDGIRGVVNLDLDAELAFRVGMAAALVLAQEKKGRALFAIGKDTRISSDLLESALIAGLCSAGADVLRFGVIPTPAVAYLTMQNHADAGIVVSASHNPYEHNGIKIFNGFGFKLSDALEARIEQLVLSGKPLPRKTNGEIGRSIYCAHQKEQYLAHLLTTVPADELAGLRIAVDCANGAASATAPELFARLPLEADIFCAEPDGVNINDGCGSTCLAHLSKIVRAGKYDLGFAFDGDADRCLAVDGNGNPIDGDCIMALCALHMQKEGRLPLDTVVATVMSNFGFHEFAMQNGLKLLCADVGDRNVLEQMLQGGYMLGGEQSGHLIFLEHATTGDGQLAALQTLSAVARAGAPLSTLAAQVPQYPQLLMNVPVAQKEEKIRIMEHPALQQAVRAAEEALAQGRVLVRPSGTEPLIRVMVEAKTEEAAQTCAASLVKLIKTL